MFITSAHLVRTTYGHIFVTIISVLHLSDQYNPPKLSLKKARGASVNLNMEIQNYGNSDSLGIFIRW